MTKCLHGALLTIGVFFLPTSIARAADPYTIIDLNNYALDAPNRPGGDWSFAHAYDINNAGMIVGDWQDNAFAFDIVNGVFLPRFTTTGNSYATGINNPGQIVGHAQDLPDGTGGLHTFMYDPLTQVYSVITGGFNNFAFDIADDGTFFTRTYSGPTGAQLLSLLDPSLGWLSLTPRAINDAGVIVGWGRQATGDDRAFVLIPTPYEIVSRNSGKCLDVYGASPDAVAPVIQWTCHGGPNQQWRLEPAGGGAFHIIARHSGQALDVYGGLLDDFTPLIQYPLHGGDNQVWTLEPASDGYVSIVARHSGKALDVELASTDDGAWMIQYMFHGGANQQWLLHAVAP
jgi:hypothetical protein